MNGMGVKALNFLRCYLVVFPQGSILCLFRSLFAMFANDRGLINCFCQDFEDAEDLGDVRNWLPVNKLTAHVLIGLTN